MNRKRGVALMLSVLLGFLGMDRFYLGKTTSGILKLVTFGGFGLWWVFDILMLAAGCTRDGAGQDLA